MTRPNFLIFVADQLRADHLGCYGNPVIHTPAIDSIAERGFRLDRFHVASSVCMPNRATMLTGRMPSVHGVRRNGIPLDRAQRTVVEHLRDRGYRTALIGKAHFQPWGLYPLTERPVESKRHLPSEDGYQCEKIELWQRDPARKAPSPYYGFEHTELCLDHGDKVEGDYARWLAQRAPEVETGRGREHALSVPQGCRDAWRTAVPESLYPSAYIAERSIAWLKEHAARRVGTTEGEPFLLMCSFPDPHHPFTPPGRFWDMYDPARVPLPATFHAPARHPVIEHVHEMTRSATKAASSHLFAPSENEARQIIALTYGMVSNVDTSVGKVLAALSTLGLDSSTIVMFTSDHGDMMGDHGVVLKGPIHFSGLTRVPLLAAGPGIAGGAHDGSCATSTVDLARTLVDLAGVEPCNGMQGRSLAGLLAGELTLPDEGVLIENESARFAFGRPKPFKVRSLVLRDWRITFSTDEALCSLHDLSRDPDERVNLWDAPSHAEIRAGLLLQLLRRMTLCADESPVPHSGG